MVVFRSSYDRISCGKGDQLYSATHSRVECHGEGTLFIIFNGEFFLTLLYTLSGYSWSKGFCLEDNQSLRISSEAAVVH